MSEKHTFIKGRCICNGCRRVTAYGRGELKKIKRSLSKWRRRQGDVVIQNYNPDYNPVCPYCGCEFDTSEEIEDGICYGCINSL